MDLLLIRPDLKYENEIRCFRQEIIDADKHRDKFAGCGGLGEYPDIPDWLISLEAREKGGATGVPTENFIALLNNNVIGMVEIRRHIDHPVYGSWGGHIGYSVRPSKRCRGYAGEMLRLALRRCGEIGIEKALVTCDFDNYASEKVILANGGKYEKTIIYDNIEVKRYWIAIKQSG